MICVQAEAERILVAGLLGRSRGGRRLPPSLAGVAKPVLAMGRWWAPTWILALALLGSGCRTGATADRPTEGARAPHLVLAVMPDRGQAPLRVQLAAELVGDLPTSAEGRCPSIAWIMGNGDVILARPADCGEDMPRRYASEYTYGAAGAYNAYARLLAVAVTPSSPRQVLVLGATPTPAPEAAMPGPTIVLATPVRTQPRVAQAPTTDRGLAPTPLPTAKRTSVPPGAGVATAPLAETGTIVAVASSGLSGTEVAVAPTGLPGIAVARASSAEPGTRVAATSAGPAGPSAVLPANLYYVARADRRLWRLPADGGAPEPVSPVGQAVGEYDVAANGAIAYVGDGALWLRLPGAEPFRVADRASRPLWSRNGRDLAYASEGVWRYRVADGRRESVAADGIPLAWSRSGDALVARRADGSVEVIGRDAAKPLVIPLAGVEEAGWFADREVFWTSGDGLRLVSMGQRIQLATLVEDRATRSVFLRPDGTLLALLASADGWQPVAISLTAALPTATTIGAAVSALQGEGFRWSPDGRHAVVVGADGIQLMDPHSGAQLPLLRAAAERPLWQLSLGGNAR